MRSSVTLYLYDYSERQAPASTLYSMRYSVDEMPRAVGYDLVLTLFHQASLSPASAETGVTSGAANICHRSACDTATEGSTGTPASIAAAKASRRPPPPASSLPNLLRITRSQPVSMSLATAAAASTAPSPAR